MSEEIENFIPGIFNYCDRWCERCHLTSRCRVFSMEQKDANTERDVTQEKFWRGLSDIFRQTSEMLQDIAAENGVDLSNIEIDELDEEWRLKQQEIEDSSLIQMSQTYSKLLDDFFKDSESLISAGGNEDALSEILQWYRLFIPAKINRGLSSHEKKDTDGSIKIALIAIDRSIMACYGLLNSTNFSWLRPLIDLLQIIRDKCEEKFPGARDFFRPGFDEIDSVM